MSRSPRSPTANPTSSTLNFPTGDTRANNVTITLDTAGKVAAVFKSGAGKATHLLVDVTGYFVAGGGAATYKPVPPVRLLDTRFGNGLSGSFAVEHAALGPDPRSRRHPATRPSPSPRT